MINKVLVANRGEIAIRVMRACRELGIASVAVYSEADKDALFAKYATEAYYIGPSPAPESYLNIRKIIESPKNAALRLFIRVMDFYRKIPTLLMPVSGKALNLSAHPAKSLS